MNKMDSITGTNLGGCDDFCIRIDNEDCPFVVSSVMIFKDNLDIEVIKDQFRQLVIKFPRFKSVIYGGTFWSRYKWREINDFDVCDFIETRQLGIGDLEELKECAAKCISEKMDLDKSLWRAYAIYGLEGGKCSALVIKVHHCIGDGQGCMHALLGLMSDGHDQLLERIKFFKDKNYSLSSESKIQTSYFTYLTYLMGILCSFLFLIGYSLFFEPIKLLSTSLKRQNLKYVGNIKYTRKTLNWTEEIKTSDISFIRKAFGVSFNDVVVTIITRAIRAYFTEINYLLDKELLIFIPISMRVSTNLDCNNSAIVRFINVSLEEQTIKESVKHVHKRMNKLKQSSVSYLAYLFYEYWPIPGVYFRKMLHSMESIGHGVITNVPGPVRPLTFAGQKVAKFVAIPPQNCPGGLGIGVVSYAGKVTCSIYDDIMPQYPNISKRISELIFEEFEIYLKAAKKLD
ncbi:hypothetical protein Glove_461g56 [Diversispora epigaea]|uniref:Uncharacterized protein n=1 Tax=Diversispora epigaea TaxID=1348612 RepID=A0A397GQ25_9GLOM|nr:hypothetical protein Glove_461g56 [Diversispora epigaea]